jgi:hypothetical protein
VARTSSEPAGAAGAAANVRSYLDFGNSLKKWSFKLAKLMWKEVQRPFATSWLLATNTPYKSLRMSFLVNRFISPPSERHIRMYNGVKTMVTTTLHLALILSRL